MRDQDDLRKLQPADHGIEVAGLIGCGVRIARGLVRSPPSEKIKKNDTTRRREMRSQTVVEVQVVREAMHQNDRRFLPRMLSDVDPMLIPRHESLLVDHQVLRTG
jgi:hypothetical protein